MFQRHLLTILLSLTPFLLYPVDYRPADEVWTSQSRNSSESMPCGGHDIGLNVWVENGDVLFYIQQSGWFDENNTLLKAGRWRLHFDGKPFDGIDFEQRLSLDEGAVTIKGGGTEVRIWADVFSPVVFVTMASPHAERATLSYESWRYKNRPVTKAECQQCSYKWILPKDCMTFADSIQAEGDRLTFSHKNREQTVFDFTVSYEHLDAIKDKLYNPIGGLKMKGVMYAPGFHYAGTTTDIYANTDYQAWNYSCDDLRTSCVMIDLRYLNHQLYEDAVVDGCGTVASYSFPTLKTSDSRKRSAQWWHNYWQRSWIESDTQNDSLQTMLRNYELMRYMLGCNAYGQWPTKFNGGLFTFDPVYVDSAATFTPDYRKWGGGTMTAQNQRLVYWPMVKSGDYDMLSSQLDTYLRLLPNAVARTRYYWGHGGASFTEQLENFGLPNPAEYGKHKEGDDLGVEKNKWLEYEWDTALEFCQMYKQILPWYPDSTLDKYQELVDETLRFFSEHYPNLVIYPGSGCETYKMARNPSSTVAALQTMKHSLDNIGVDTSFIPKIPLQVIDGDTCIAPAESWERIQNTETPQLYPVFPWRIYGVGRPHLNIARNTYFKDPHALEMRSTKGWKQDNIWAACLGLTDEARRLNTEKLSNGPYRFPAFWDAGFDWAPDHNRGGAGMIGLQEMLLQEGEDHTPILFPAWPREWNCRFCLYISGRRRIEGEIKNGIITYTEDGVRGEKTASAKLVVTKTLCNYQSEPTAIVDGKIRVGWQYKDEAKSSAMQDGYQIIITERITNRQIYDSGIINSDQSQFIELPALKPNRYGYQWKVRIREKESFSDWSQTQTIRIMPRMHPQWIGAITKKDAGIPNGRWSNEVFKRDSFQAKWRDVDTLSTKSIILNKEATIPKKITDAIVYVCGLGHYELTINGQKVGDSEFAPLWSEYSKTVYYNVYEVTHLLKQGKNTISAILGNGFFNVQRGNRYSKLQGSFGPPQLFFRMDVTYSDGTTEQIVSDKSWLWSLSPITFNSIYGGESYDARLEEATDWQPVVMTEGPEGVLRPETCQPVKVMEHYDIQSWKSIPKDSLESASAKTKRTIAPSVFVCDMGQNLAGFPEITVSGQRGQKITLLVSERLTPQGVCNQSQTGRQHYYEYILKGNGQEQWHPRFSYYGFRYIQVEGAVLEGQPNPRHLPVIHCLRSCFVYNSAAETSSFWCNNELFNKTHRLIERAERSNMQAVMTDCPHREKLGWLEQDHLCGPSLLYNYDMTRLVPKIIRDIVDTQKPYGMVPTTAPQYVSFGNLFDDSPEWGSTLIILPFQYYDMYGDSTLITDNYEPMRRYVDYLTSRSEDGIVSHGLGDWYDYGPWKAGFSRNTPIPLVATAHYIYDLQLLTEAARMTGRQEDIKKYGMLYQQVVESFNRHFYNPDSCYYGTGSQTSNALPLFLDICGEHKEAVLQSLIADIHAHGDRLTTGDVGNRYLFRVLADNGYNELLFKMLNHDETPGYGFQIAQGATTLTEQWDPRQGASENHFMMGQIDEWLFRTLSGIRQKPGTYGMRHLVIDPIRVGDIRHIRTTIQTLYGEIQVELLPNDSLPRIMLPGGCR